MQNRSDVSQIPEDRRVRYVVQKQTEIFDGKRLRRAMVRKTVDLQAPAARWLLDRTWQQDSRQGPPLEPSAEYIYRLQPPCAAAFRERPITNACTHFVQHAQNKQKCGINACCWTPEGRRLITGATSGEFTLWNGWTFNFETILLAHNLAVRNITWSHDGKFMISTDQSGIVKYWQSNLNHLKVFRAHQETIRDLAIAPTDQKLATCSDDQTIRVFDFESPARAGEIQGSPERILRGHGWDVRSVDWHPTRGLLASGSKDSLIKLWDPKSGKCLTTIHAHKNAVVKVRWNPSNANYLLSGSRDQTVKLIDIRMMRSVQSFHGHRREVTTLAWHPIQEDTFVSAGYDGSLFFWVLGDPEPAAVISNAHATQVWDLSWHPLGHVLVSSGNDTYTRFWTRSRPGDGMRDRYQRSSCRWEHVKLYATEDDPLVREVEELEALQGNGGVDGFGESLLDRHVMMVKRQRTTAAQRPPPGLEYVQNDVQMAKS